ncbi:ABC transporter substrate-binding protein [Pseudarthrobacter oxydans]|uniref:ABC transporter substrate-binding protein n=1 Tax=Pseudarthrobacter oxydans TaxID=1671 RepID=UPI0038217534
MKRRLWIAPALAAALLTLAGCGSGPTASTGTGDPANPDNVTIGLVPIVDVAPVYLGISKGFYADQGINLTPELASGGAALLPAVVSGSYQFGFSEVASLIVASSKGLPIDMVAPASSSTGDAADDYAGVLVPASSSAQSMKDLEGKKVAINSIQGINYVLARDAVDSAGGDSSKVNFVEMAFPDMLTALSSGQIDAAFEPQPFFDIGQSQGARNLYSLYAESTPNLEVTAYFTTTEYAQQNPDLVSRFVTATQQSLTYAAEHPDEARDALSTYTKIDPGLIATMTLPDWPSDFNEDSLGFVAGLTDKYGLTANKVDVSQMINTAK